MEAAVEESSEINFQAGLLLQQGQGQVLQCEVLEKWWRTRVATQDTLHPEEYDLHEVHQQKGHQIQRHKSEEDERRQHFEKQRQYFAVVKVREFQAALSSEMPRWRHRWLPEWRVIIY